MGVGEIIGGVLIILMSVFLIVVITMQEGSSNGGGANAVTGASSGDSYYGKNSGRTLEAMLKRITKMSIGIFFVLVVILNFVAVFLKK